MATSGQGEASAMLLIVAIASCALHGTHAASIPVPKPLSLHSAMVRKISEHIIATLSRRAHATVPAFNVRLEANLIAEGAPREASVIQRAFARVDGGEVVPEDIRALEHGYEFFVSILAAFRPQSTLLSEINPWPHWELALTRVWTKRGESTLHVTALVEPPRQKLAAEDAAAERVARFALASMWRERGTHLAAVIAAESQHVDVIRPGRGGKGEPETRTKVFYVSFLTVAMAHPSSPARQHVVAVAQMGAVLDERKLRLLRHVACHSPGITLLKGTLSLPTAMAGAHFTSTAAREVRKMLATAAGRGGWADATDVSLVHAADGAIEWHIVVPGDAKTAEEALTSRAMARALAGRLGLRSAAGVEIWPGGKLSSAQGQQCKKGTEECRTAGKGDRDDGHNSLGIVALPVLAGAVLGSIAITSAAWLKVIQRRDGLSLSAVHATPGYHAVSANSRGSVRGEYQGMQEAETFPL